MLHTLYHALAWTWGGDHQGYGNSTGYLIFSGPLPDITLLAGLGALYHKHRCHHCPRLARFHVGEHQVPTCHRHREKEAKA